MAQRDTITVVYEDRPPTPRPPRQTGGRDEGTDPGRDRPTFGPSRLAERVGEIDTETLSNSLKKLTRQMNELFDDLAENSGQFELSSFDVAVEITGSGEVRLIGAVSLSVTGGITLSFRRKAVPGPGA